MTLSEAKRFFRNLTARYFKDANVIYSNQSHAVKPTSKPLVTIAFGNIKQPINPPTIIVDGRPVSYYPTVVTATVNLFTHGRKIEIAKGITPAYEDTATEDLASFLDFLNSEVAITLCSENDIAVIVPNDVMTLSGLINDVIYEYRAKAEVEIRFTSTAAGYSGTLPAESVSITVPEPQPMPEQESRSKGFFGATELYDSPKPTESVTPKPVTSPSGGNNEDFISEEDYYFTNVVISGKKVKPDE